MSALYLLTAARIREFLREPGAMFWTYGFPVLITVALGLAFRQQGPPSVNVGVIGSADVQNALAASKGGSKIAPQVMTRAEMTVALRRAKIVIGVDASDPNAIVYLLDPARPDAEALRLQAADALQRLAGRQDSVGTRREESTQPGGRYIDWLVPGLVGMQLMSAGMWGVGWVVVDMRQRKLMKRLVATPMKRSHFLLSFLFLRLIGVFWELGIIMGFGALAFDVTVQGSLLLTTGIGILGALVFAGLGLATACRAQNTQTAGGLMNLVMLPMFVLSGVFFSSVNFPEWMQPVIRALPLTALNDAFRAVINDGAGLIEVLPKITILSVWGVVSFVIALKFFRWN
jgi:ABC-2 type transport system permease protein